MLFFVILVIVIFVGIIGCFKCGVKGDYVLVFEVCLLEILLDLIVFSIIGGV